RRGRCNGAVSRKIRMPPPSGCMFISPLGLLPGVTSFGEVARRSFRLVRRDLWLQIDPSALDDRAGYILRPRPLITSFLGIRLCRRTLAAVAPWLSTPFPEAVCYHTMHPLHNRLLPTNQHCPPRGLASASTLPATATTPLSCATTSSPPPPNSP